MSDKLFRATTVMTPVIFKDFYKFYYRDRLKAFSIIATVISVLAIAAGIMLYARGFHPVWTALLVWLGVFLLVYPRVAYRRPYKRAKDQHITTYFSFYDTYVEERTSGEKGNYPYTELLKVVETPKYIFIYHTPESVSIVDKETVKEGSDGLCALLEGKTNYKKVK